MRRAFILLIAGCRITAAQDSVKLRDALEWTIALRGRMAQMTNPVVRVHGVASVAGLVCPLSQGEASGLYREAITALHGIPSNAFTDKGTTVLPAASFTGLWKYVVPAALKCDPGLAEAANNQRSKERIDAERRGANATLRHAWYLIDPTQVLDKQDNNDRAAQVANAALDAGDPDQLDIALLTRFMSQLRDHAPDLADDLFLRGLDFVMSASVPNPGALQELAKYLFTAPKLVDKPDTDQQSDSFQTGGTTIEVLTATRGSSNPDDIESLIDTTMRLLNLPAAVNLNPLAAYSLAWQLLPRARDLAPDRAADLETAIANLEAQTAGAAQIQSRLGAGENPGADSGSPAYRDYRLTGQIQNALAGGRIDQARALLPRMSDFAARGQLSALIDFREAGGAIEAHRDQAMALANLLRGGIKRSLLYIAIIGSAKQQDTALQVLPLAAKDIMPLPAEQRVRLLSALSAALVRCDTQSAMGTLDLLVRAYNDVYANPRRGKFDPRAARLIFNTDSTVDTSTDTSLILTGTRGFYEAVQTELGRHNFMLKVPGVTALSIGNFLSSAATVDPGLLEAAVLGLRDENTRAQALVRLAEVRIKTAKTAPAK